jgi:two-component system, sensor histidine kinase
MWSYVTESIRRKLTVAILSTAIVALLVTVAAMGVYDLRRYHAELVNDLVTQADVLGRLSAPALAFDDPKAAAGNLAALRLRPQVRAAAIYDVRGELFAIYPPPSAGIEPPDVPLALQADGHYVEGRRMAVFHTITEDGRSVGTVFISARYELTRRLVGYLMIVGLSIAASMVVALALSTWLQDAITGPILAVARVAQRVMQTRDYSLRVEKTTDDEVGVLVDAFNEMLAEAGRRAAALENANAELTYEMRERHAAEQALRAADQRKDEFLATLAHELRNPLAPIRNALYLMQATDDPKVIANARAMMDRQLTQLVRLVDDLLDVSRITTGKLALRAAPVMLQDVLASAIEAVRPLIDAKRHTLKVELRSEPIALEADPARLSQVFANILNNAAKYTDPGGTIRLRTETHPGNVTVRIEDTGIGIAEDKLADVFNMFAQVDESLERAHGGLGVGLALARRLVQMHGGTIHATSAGLGRGSQFIITLPVRQPVPTSDPQPEANGRSSVTPHRVLLVDDNRDFVSSMAALIELQGHTVRTAHDGREAEQVALSFQPQIAFLDLGLPLVNGYDLARRLRAQESTARAVLVAVSGWGQDKDRERAREAGFDLHLVKPVEVDQVLQMVGELAGMRATTTPKPA